MNHEVKTTPKISMVETERIGEYLNQLINRHNALCDVEKIFQKDKSAAGAYFVAAQELEGKPDVTVGQIFAKAIEILSEIAEASEKPTDEQKKIQKLEKENQELKEKLRLIQGIAKE